MEFDQAALGDGRGDRLHRSRQIERQRAGPRLDDLMGGTHHRDVRVDRLDAFLDLDAGRGIKRLELDVLRLREAGRSARRLREAHMGVVPETDGPERAGRVAQDELAGIGTAVDHVHPRGPDRIRIGRERERAAGGRHGDVEHLIAVAGTGQGRDVSGRDGMVGVEVEGVRGERLRHRRRQLDQLEIGEVAPEVGARRDAVARHAAARRDDTDGRADVRQIRRAGDLIPAGTVARGGAARRPEAERARRVVHPADVEAPRPVLGVAVGVPVAAPPLRGDRRGDLRRDEIAGDGELTAQVAVVGDVGVDAGLEGAGPVVADQTAAGDAGRAARRRPGGAVEDEVLADEVEPRSGTVAPQRAERQVIRHPDEGGSGHAAEVREVVLRAGRRVVLPVGRQVPNERRRRRRNAARFRADPFPLLRRGGAKDGRDKSRTHDEPSDASCRLRNPSQHEILRCTASSEQTNIMRTL